MSEFLYQAQALINNNKLRKAQILLKKFNNKSPSYSSLNLEAYCLYKDQKFALATPRYQQALTLNPPIEHKKSLLQKLAVCQIKSNQKQLAIRTLLINLSLDSSANNAECRMILGRVATELGQSELVLEYLPKLLNLTRYTTEALLLLIDAAVSTENTDKEQEYEAKILSNCHFYSSEEAANFLGKFLQRINTLLAKKILNVLALKHSHQKWFAEFTSLISANNLAPHKIPTPPNKKINGKNKKLLALINALLEDNEKRGAFFHEKIRIFEDDGNLSIKAFIDNLDNEKLLSIPLSCMPLMNDYTLELNNKKDIIAKPIKYMQNPTANNTMQLLISIYNQTNKIESWHEVFPFLALEKQPKLLAKLVAGKQSNSKILSYFKLILAKDHKKLILDSFLGSRAFAYPKEKLAEAGIFINNESELGLLSIIDFLNHKVSSTNYQNEKGTLFVAGKADATSQELFVHYNNFDPLLTYLIYGFVDTHSPLLFSTPIKIISSNGVKIKILGNSELTSADNHSKNVNFSADYLPNINMTTLTEKQYNVDTLVIPNKAHKQLLRESLLMLVKNINKGNYFSTDEQFSDEVLHLEQQIINQNLKYWCELEALNTKKNTDVALLACTTKQHINSYANSFGISLF